MKQLLGILVLGLLLSGNAYADIIKLICVDDDTLSTLEPKIDTKNKSAIMGELSFSVFVGEMHYSLHGVKEDVSMYIHRISGGFKSKIGSKVISKGKCTKDKKLKF